MGMAMIPLKDAFGSTVFQCRWYVCMGVWRIMGVYEQIGWHI
jgi:hypothetical protein